MCDSESLIENLAFYKLQALHCIDTPPKKNFDTASNNEPFIIEKTLSLKDRTEALHTVNAVFNRKRQKSLTRLVSLWFIQQVNYLAQYQIHSEKSAARGVTVHFGQNETCQHVESELSVCCCVFYHGIKDARGCFYCWMHYDVCTSSFTHSLYWSVLLIVLFIQRRDKLLRIRSEERRVG